MPTIAVIERLLRRIERLDLPANWTELTPAELSLDSLDRVELQLELETLCEVTLLDDSVVESPLEKLSMAGLANYIDALRCATTATK